MKNNLLYLLFLAVVFYGCQKDDTRVFSETVDQRLNKTLKDYENQLLSSPNGWKAVVTPANGTGYSFFFKFEDSNRVVMYSDFDTTSASVGRESSYRLKALQQPSLVFDTYNYIHLLSDPNANINGGSFGAGLSSDFEFAFQGMVGDTIKLIGRVNGSRVNLIKATKPEADAWANQSVAAAIKSLSKISLIQNYFKRLTVGGREYEILVDQFRRTVIITWIDANGTPQTFTTGYSYSGSPAGITFTTPFNSGNGIIPGIYGVVFNTTTTVIDVNIGNNVTGTIAGAIRPISPNLTAASSFWNRSVTQDSYWISFTGFTVNGVVDAFGVTKIPNYQFLLFWAQYGVSGGINYDLLGFVIGNSINYGPAFRPPTFTTDGRIIFPYLGLLGSANISATVLPIVTNTRTMMADPAGFWIIQTSENTVDMVSAKDAKSWITWEW